MATDVERLTDRVTEFFLNDQRLIDQLDALTTKTVGWRPETDNDEEDPRYELWWATRCNILNKVVATALSQMYYPQPYPFATDYGGGDR